jgi:hypothetical protein
LGEELVEGGEVFGAVLILLRGGRGSVEFRDDLRKFVLVGRHYLNMTQGRGPAFSADGQVGL